MKKKKLPVLVKFLLVIFTLALFLFVANEYLMGMFMGRIFGQSGDLSDIKIGEFRPFLPVAKLICQIKGRSYQQIDLYEVINGNSWVCAPKFEVPSCPGDGPCYYKPVIYLYPERKTEVNVKIKYNPGFSVTYPSYQNGWNVTAEPNGKLTDNYDGKEYSYLFWEGNSDPSAQYDMSTGFVVKGNETAEFLQNKLKEIGLTPKEYNEFIVYWYPKMKQNPYNLIHFASTSEYDDKVVMKVSPKPDSVLRMFMVYRSLEKSVTIQPQNFIPFVRKGFTVIEWGGTELKTIE
ncbi:MAG: hypothetical protein WC596_00220 [Candidatus Shapirobacteria bacterium]